ncbi:MAG: sensor histidine kinase [Turicibacter bilis]|nr:sensor histidine kinase [Turicibacter bilis]
MFLAIFSIILTLYYHSFTNVDEIFSLLFLIIISCLASYIKEEHGKKLDAQVLYDELRISEEQLKQAKEELELYASSMAELAVLKERNRISRDIHDSVGHAISTAMIQLNAIEVIAKKEKSSVAPLAANLRDFLKDGLQEVRIAIAQLKPSEYKTYQELYRIEELIQNFEKLSGINVRLTISKNKWELSQKLGLTLYRIIQEALSNALRHGQATEVRLVLNFAPENLILTIDNNGRGCESIKKGVGLTSMTERISEMNGKLTFFPAQTGFKIQVILPKGKEEIYD